MSTYRLVADQDRCIACHACEAICRTIHDAAPGIAPGTLLVDGPRFADAEAEKTPLLTRHGTPQPDPVIQNESGAPRVVLQVRYRACVQCPKPRCVEACPKQAMVRDEDGVVYVDETLCVGCGLCVKACPHQLVQVDPRRRKAVKCDQCRKRRRSGLQPACITVCPTQALQLVEKKH